MIDHDAKPGPLMRCQICGSTHLREIIDLGHQPLCDALIKPEDLMRPEVTYPLALMQCEECTLAQLSDVVDGSAVYPASYPYRAGLSWPVVEAHKRMARDLLERYGRGFVVDIGSNDGTLLSQFQAAGCANVLGFEPTDISKIAARTGVPTIQAPFTERTASHCGQAHIITMTNVFAHMAGLGDVMRGIQRMLASDGVLVIENHYLLDILASTQFDSIYHEHIRTYTLRSLIRLFGQYGLEVFDVQRMPRYGGNIRAHVCWAGSRRIDADVGDMLRAEDAAGVASAAAWSGWRDRVYRARDSFREMLSAWRGHVVGCSAPGRASTLLNFFGVSSHEMPYTGELDGSLKIGKHLPGCHIPVVSNRRIVTECPPIVVLLAWHYAAEIAERLRREGVTSRLIAPLPTFSEIRTNEAASGHLAA
jgi:hypothetical protein